jgi:hypothetical protein
MSTFFKYYQIIRNLIHIDEESYIVFLYPEDNSSVARAAEFAKKEIVKQQYSEHLLNVTWEDITSSLARVIKSDEEKEYLSEFRAKYLNYSKV